MIKREFQKITSHYGKRPGFKLFHRGVDLRTWNDGFSEKLPVVLPEDAIFARKVYQKKWGWTYVFEPTISGYYEIKFIHMEENNYLVKDKVYEKGHEVGFTMTTPYMRKKGYGDHLHFEVWADKKTTENPLIYFQKLGIRYA